MRPLRYERFSLGRFCLTLFLLSMTWTPVKLEQSERVCVEAPRVPTMTHCTRCAKDVVPNEDVGLVEDPLPPSTEYCLKWFNRVETEYTEDILNMTLISNEDHLGVAQLIGTEEIPLEDCRNSKTPNTNPLIDQDDDDQCIRSESDEIKGTCASQLMYGLKKLVALLSTEVGKRSLPSCDDFEDYTGKDEPSEGLAEVKNDTSSEATKPKLRVMRDRKISNVSFYSLAWVIDGRRVDLSQNVIGHGILANWFSKRDCPDDPIVGGVNFSSSNYPHLKLVADVTIMKGWSSTQPGLYYEQTRLNLSRTSGNEDIQRMGAKGKNIVATFTSDECKAVDIFKDSRSITTDNKTVDDEGNKLVDFDLLREDIYTKVESEINEIDVGEAEGETVQDKEETRQSCEVSAEGYDRLEVLYAVPINTFARSVLSHQTISPVYNSYSNRTLLEYSPYVSVDVVEQYANSTALPSYDYSLMQVTQRLDGREWERVVETGISSSVSVLAEMGVSLLHDYKKTFAFYNKQGPLLVHLRFIDVNDFKVRIEKPLEAWELILQLRVLGWFPLNATFRADEMNQFVSFHNPTHPVINATLREAEDATNFTVKWNLIAGSNQLTELLEMGKGLINIVFGKSDGAPESDGVLDLLASFLTGTTTEEQRRGEEIVSEELASMVKLALKKLISLSATAPKDPTTVEEMLLAGWRVLWDILNFVGLVVESESPTPSEGEFLVDYDHFIKLLLWFLTTTGC